MNADAHHLVDRLLRERGYYDPADLLLLEGHINDDSYAKYRHDEIDSRGAPIVGNLQPLTSLLEAAGLYARRLGLEPQDYKTVASEQLSDTLTLYQDKQFDQLLHTRYAPSCERPQLDLFMDTSATMLYHQISKSLSEFQIGRAETLIKQLHEVDSSNVYLGGFKSLLEVIKQNAEPIENISAKLQQLEFEIVPLASRVLGKYSYPFIQPLWLRLSEALGERPFNPDDPNIHHSYTDIKIKQWGRVRSKIEQEPGWKHHFVLLKRHLQAATMQYDEQVMIEDYLFICWIHPDNVEQIAMEHAIGILPDAIAEFNALDTELTIELFPAWLLLRHPGMTQRLAIDLMPDENSDGQIWPIMHQLQSSSRENFQINLRAELQSLAPELFKLFMQQL